MPRVLVFYHYFHPDDVVSAQHFADLCRGLHAHGWDVTVMPCNRGCRDESQVFPPGEEWDGIHIKRVRRPAFRQNSTLGRLANAAWMIAAWSLAAFRRPVPDCVIVGTDPILSVLIACVWKLVRRRTRIVHWCFDLYPEAAIADGLLREQSFPIRLMKRFLRSAYRACDLIVDIGPCMRDRLGLYRHGARVETFTPWALVEPKEPESIDAEERKLVFEDARIGLMYSGSFGRAHSCRWILELARLLRNDSVRMAFSVRGNREKELRDSVTPDDTNIAFVPFAPMDRLDKRLGAADIHVVSLREEWTGAVVPSKFFGALAIGRPVVFEGSPDSAIARWIREYGVGWVLDEESLPRVVEEIRELANSEKARLELFARCHRVYKEHFARETVIEAWHRAQTELLRG
jgi:colanic acid biosynthesis glycosyl transferase WcaI